MMGFKSGAQRRAQLGAIDKRLILPRQLLVNGSHICAIRSQCHRALLHRTLAVVFGVV
jgi:hypothetical protein